MERLVYTFNRIFHGLFMENGVANRPGLAMQLGVFIQNKVLSTVPCNSRAYIDFLSNSGSTGSATTTHSLGIQLLINRLFELIYPVYKSPPGLSCQAGTILITSAIPNRPSSHYSY
ncbi:hypothetical protein [Spirosoma pollinicola]|uniref:hypothetical protein n=1 Tax=Spirosoma pollinicola TaxID=2057025 RepID=UPI0012FE0510|nr:hypothetical protein [Spirosoma pollinicola]